MNESSGVVRRIAWPEVFPWLILLRTFRIAISPPLLALAAAAVLLVPLGWRLAGRIFLTAEQREDRLAASDAMPRSANSRLASEVPTAPRPYLPSAPTALLEAYFDLSEPLRRFFRLEITLREAFYYLIGFLWTLAVWAFPGGVIAPRRRAIGHRVIQRHRGRISVCRHPLSLLHLRPLYPFAIVLALAVPIAILGLFLRLSLGLGAAISGLLWILVMLASLAATWLLGGLLLGWPLMWPAISAEQEGDAFEAFSRSYSYVYGRPLHYFFYVVVAAALGALSWAVVTVAGEIVQEFGFWALAWGSGKDAAALIREQALDFAQGEGGWLRTGVLWKFGAALIGICLILLHALVTAFRFTYFFAAASGIYLLLRQDVDEKELDEVYVEPTVDRSPA